MDDDGTRSDATGQMMATVTHVAYADEAQYNTGRFRGVGVVSLRYADAERLGDELRALLDASGVAECKWERLRSARMRFAAEKLVAWTLERALAGTLRLDVLTWDVEDHQRTGHGPGHILNLRRMFERLFTRALIEEWSDTNARWLVRPDEQDAIPWEALAARLPGIERIVPAQSHREPLVQVADLFTGMAVFSRNAYDLYEQWLCLPERERGEPESEDAPPERLSGSVRQRCLVLDAFFTQCKLHQLGVSLRTQRGLRTYEPTHPVNFWWYAE